MKAVLLARGLGSRMKDDAPVALTEEQARAAAAGAKGMMPIGPGTRPFLDYVLSALADAGCTSVCLVVAPDHAAIREYYDGRGRPSRVGLSYAVQPSADGTARAVQSAEAFTADDPFLALNSDNLYSAAAMRALVELDGPGLAAYQRDTLIDDSGFPAERIASFAAIEVDPDGYLTHIVEKPRCDAAGRGALISMNLWRFDRQIFAACRDVPISARGEYELSEAVGLAVTRGVRFKTVRARGAVLDLSRRADIGLVSERLSTAEARP